MAKLNGQKDQQLTLALIPQHWIYKQFFPSVLGIGT